MKVGPDHVWIPDTQIKPDVPIDHIGWAGDYIRETKPDRVIIGGDWWDFPALSYFDEGKKAGEGRRVSDDIEAGNAGMALLDRKMRGNSKTYSPGRDFIEGNHEVRLDTAINNNPKLEGTLSKSDLAITKHGFAFHEFLKPIERDGITYMHYCPIGPSGRTGPSKNGAPSARIQIQRMMRTTVCGHRQGKDLAELYTPGRIIRGVIAGSFYQHEEGYLSRAGETYWRGILRFRNIRNGNFELEEISLDDLRARYG